MKKHVISILILCCLLISSVMTFAVDSRILSSGHDLIQTSYGGIYANGYTESNWYHYTTAQLLCSNGQLLTSDRVWGTGTVWASTNSMWYDSDLQYQALVYYGFEN